MTSAVDISNHIQHGPWKNLQALAWQMCVDASNRAGAELKPLLGGGTRLMLSLSHRISDDIDLFLTTPQWLGYLTPRLNDRFEAEFESYSEQGDHLKLVTKDGEIDFIVRAPLLDRTTTQSSHSPFELESVDEVLAKKLFHRGWALTPRDLFDWHKIQIAKASFQSPENYAALLRGKLTAMRSRPAAQLIWDNIRAADKPVFSETVDWALSKVADMSRLSESLRMRTVVSKQEQPPG